MAWFELSFLGSLGSWCKRGTQLFLPLCATKFRIISSTDLPKGGPERMNTHAQPEQLQPSIRFTQIISRAMPDYGDAGGISHYTGFPSLALICSSVFILADSAIRGCAISSVTLAMIALSDISLAFLSFLLLRIQLFSYQTRSNAVQSNPEDFLRAPHLPLPAVFPPCHLRDETSSDDRVAWFPTHTKRCIPYR
jgi:hypothetical protein